MNASFTDKEILEDMLSSQKAITGVYNSFTNECAHQCVRTDLLNILQDEHNIQANIFTEMQKRGWYAVTDADAGQITQARDKFQTMAATL
ncbi:MAG: spore coat protein [Clostridia bacterium]|nr:spore coat protein [Clostridia bacterium]